MASGANEGCTQLHQSVTSSSVNVTASMNSLGIEGVPVNVVMGLSKLAKFYAAIDLVRCLLEDLKLRHKTIQEGLRSDFELILDDNGGTEEEDSTKMSSSRKDSSSDEVIGEKTMVVLLSSEQPPSCNENFFEESTDILAYLQDQNLHHLLSCSFIDVQEELYRADILTFCLDDLYSYEAPEMHFTELIDTRPRFAKRCLMLSDYYKIIQTEIRKMLGAGIIVPAPSLGSFYGILTLKKVGAPRFCVDHCTLNQVAKMERMPLSNI